MDLSLFGPAHAMLEGCTVTLVEDDDASGSSVSLYARVAYEAGTEIDGDDLAMRPPGAFELVLLVGGAITAPVLRAYRETLQEWLADGARLSWLGWDELSVLRRLAGPGRNEQRLWLPALAVQA